MQVVVAVVAGERVLDTVEREAATGDTVGVASANGAKVRMLLEVTINAVEAEHDIARATLAVRHQQRCHDAAVVRNLGAHPCGIGQGIEVYLRAVGRRSQKLVS